LLPVSLVGEIDVELASYLEFLANDAIRIIGTPVGIETVVCDYQEGASPEEIALCYPSLPLAQIHATIIYYRAHPDRGNAYFPRVRQQQKPPISRPSSILPR
jgi:Protein of unknown function (DUF433)